MSVLRSILHPARRLLNMAGVDLVRFKPNTKRPAAGGLQPRSSAPRRIVIGGGDQNYGPDWHNIEYVTDGYADKYKTLNSNIDIPHDLTSGKPFQIQDESIIAAYSSHVFEHLKDGHIRFVLRDTARVLQAGGYLRVSCPNIDLYVRAFLERDLEFFHYRDHPHYAKLGISRSVAGLFLDVFATRLGEQTQALTYDEVHASLDRIGVEKTLEYYCNQADYDYARSHYHVNWFNPAKLMHMFREAGFRKVYLSALGQSYCPDMRDLRLFDMGDPKISMFVEGRK